MTASKPLRVGVIGCGGIAQMMHLPYLQSLPELYEIAALSDLSPGVMERLGAKYGVPKDHLYTNAQDLIDQNLDAVLVLTGGNHYPQTVAALRAGKHVFAEKPLCVTVAEADEIVAAAKQANRVLMVGNMKRHDPGYIYAQRFVQTMEDIRYVQINTLHPAETDYVSFHRVLRFGDIAPDVIASLIHDDDVSAVKAVGEVTPKLREIYVGVFLGSMVHDVNALRGLLGEPEEVLFSDLWPQETNDVSITTTIRYPNDVRVVYTWTYLAEVRDYFQEMAVMSSGNRVRIQFPSPFLRHFPTPIVVQGMEDGAAYTKQVIVSYEEAFQQELISFYDCVINGTPPPTDGESARTDIVFLQKIFAKLHPMGLGGEAAQYS
jgi:predicted dehydrogenase